MDRLNISARADWREKVEQLGFTFHTINGEPYWDETACYRFSSEEIDAIESASNELQSLCLIAVEHVIVQNRFAQMGIPAELVPLIISSWEQDHPSIYGRFDLAYDGCDQIKLLEYNADTPTSLLEAAVVQWHWLEEVFPGADQFNSIHEQLIEVWKWIKENLVHNGILYFTSMDDLEDETTTMYLMDTAIQAGIATNCLLLQDIGWHEDLSRFVDLDNRIIRNVFKLYPWEWFTTDKFWPYLRNSFGEMRWIEPAWKMVLSCKGILPVLWELNPGHPLLLEAYFDGPCNMTEYARKPLFSREGANVSIITHGGTICSPGEYGREGYIYQALAPLPYFDGNYAVLGSWIIGDTACGMGIRESVGPITTNQSRFIPHFFE